MKYILSLTVSMILVLSGCTKIPYIVLFNNSSSALTIHFQGTDYSVAAGAIVEIKFSDNRGLLEIKLASGTAWKYQVAYPNKAYMNGNTFNVQLEADGIIYVLPSAAKSSLKILPPQPDGFPWNPK